MQVAHLWANQSQDNARTSTGNFWFQGPALYSFRTPIAALWPAARGARVALVQSRQYSMRTAKHRNDACRALRGNVRNFHVPSIGAGGGRSFESAATRVPDHAGNLGYLIAQYRDAVAHFGRMMSRPYDGGRDRLQYLAREANDYSAAFFPRRKAPISAENIEADIAAIEAKHAAKDAKRAAPGYAEKLERARVRREAARERRDAERAEARRRSAEEYAAQRERNRIEREERLRQEAIEREERLRQEAIELPLIIEAWRRGERVYRSLYDLPCMLRAHPSNPAIVQTSQGAEVPIAQAEILFAVVARCRRQGKGFLVTDDAGQRMPIGGFQVREISTTGDIVVGCHSIGWPEIERFAISQGWTVAPFAEYVPTTTVNAEG